MSPGRRRGTSRPRREANGVHRLPAGRQRQPAVEAHRPDHRQVGAPVHRPRGIHACHRPIARFAPDSSRNTRRRTSTVAAQARNATRSAWTVARSSSTGCRRAVLRRRDAAVPCRRATSTRPAWPADRGRRWRAADGPSAVTLLRASSCGFSPQEGLESGTATHPLDRRGGSADTH